jgi:hypothetical protein
MAGAVVAAGLVPGQKIHMSVMAGLVPAMHAGQHRHYEPGHELAGATPRYLY